MNKIIFVLGDDARFLSFLKPILDDSYRLHSISRQNLVREIYKNKPMAIIINYDAMDHRGFLNVDATLSLEYIPTVCISLTQEVFFNQPLKHASYLGLNEVSYVLPHLINQAATFYNKYDAVHTSLDTYDIMNEEVQSVLEQLLKVKRVKGQSVIRRFLLSVYTNNFFIINKPHKIWVLKPKENHEYHSDYYSLKADGLYGSLNFIDSVFDMNIYMETGFYKNTQDEELSDIDSIKQLLPEKILEKEGRVTNVACFATHRLMVIALDYGQKIKQQDLNVLKALAIKLDLIQDIHNRVEELKDAFIYTMNALARAAEGKDDVTGHHIKRVNHYSVILANGLMMDETFVDDIAVAAQMHDVGKIMIPDEILNKPGKLTEDEFEEIKRHTLYGEEVIGDAIYLRMASQIAKNHHEKYDGSGYPEGLKGEAIPLAARIVALADVYDALRSERPYKRGFTHEETCQIILEGDGRVEPQHFDPNVLRVFEKEHQKFKVAFISLPD